MTLLCLKGKCFGLFVELVCAHIWAQTSVPLFMHLKMDTRLIRGVKC